jgi:PhzF family phenazine biosynthesis protein
LAPHRAGTVLRVRIRVIDAFTEKPFAGNPAGVCLLDDGFPDAAWMQSVAAEMNHSETAFAHPREDGGWELRWFTPKVEVKLCGHATLATVHALHSDGLIGDSVRFHCLSGVLTAAVAEEITLDFPAAPPVEIDAPPGVTEALGAAPAEILGTGALNDLLTVFDDEATVRGLAPDFAAVARISDFRAIIATAPGADFDYVSRFFAPRVGIDEDPVTGGAHTALAPYWAARLSRDPLVGFQASPRGGVVGTSVHGDRVHLRGRAVTVLDGTLAVNTP